MEDIPSQSPTIERAGSEALDQDVGMGRQAPQRFAVAAIAQIQGDGLRTAQKGREADADAVDLRRHHAHRVTSTGLLDLDQSRAEINQLTGEHGARQHTTQIEHRDPVERWRLCWAHE